MYKPTHSTLSTEESEGSMYQQEMSFLDQDPEAWIKNNIISKNLPLVAPSVLERGLNFFDSPSRSTSVESQEDVKAAAEQVQEQEELTIEKSYASEDFIMNFFQKSEDEVRRAYINKLVAMKVMKLQPAKKSQSLIIFDWDDTLLPTHAIQKAGFTNLPPEFMANLVPLDASACRLLMTCVEHGETVIITNAVEGWVESSSKVFMPMTHRFIRENNIKILSARTRYEEKFPGDSHRWKVETFMSLERSLEKSAITNLICIGDSHIEMDAVKLLAQKFKNALIKTVRMKQHPRPDDLAKQHILINQRMETIYTSFKNVTIRLEKKADN